MLSTFLDSNQNVKLCGKNHNPNLYYSSSDDRRYWSYNYRSNYTSDMFLCNVAQWEQGDWVDNAGLSGVGGMATDSGLSSGRH
eukprot:12333-Eustigmatos_ZCMA.PRE.1